MPILITLFSVAGAGFAYWFVRLGGHEVISAMFSAQARERRHLRNRDTQARAAVRSISDPRDAAMALLMRIGSVDGEVAPAAEVIIERAASEIFQFGEQASERKTFAAFVARNTPSSRMLVEEVAPLLRTKLDAAERRQLLDLLSQTAVAAGGLTTARQEQIEALAVALGRK